MCDSYLRQCFDNYGGPSTLVFDVSKERSLLHLYCDGGQQIWSLNDVQDNVGTSPVYDPHLKRREECTFEMNK